MNHEIIALWAVPRSASTALERMWRERRDLRVLHEPFSLSYYFSPDRPSLRFADRPADPEHRFERVLEKVARAAESGPVLFKDMPHHAEPCAGEGFLARFRNAFLIRHPRLTLASLAQRMPVFTYEETGFPALARFFDRAADLRGAPPPLVDANDLCADPPGIVRALCAALGVPFLEEALTWEPGPQPGWASWERWHERVARTRGFGPPRDPAEVPVPDNPCVREMLPRCEAIYERLLEHRLSPIPAEAAARPTPPRGRRTAP